MHDGIRISVRPYIVETLRPGLPRTIAVMFIGLILFFPISAAFPFLTTLMFLAALLGTIMASMLWGNIQRVRSLRAARAGLVLYLRPHTLTLEWSQDGLPTKVDRIDPQDVDLIDLCEAGFRMPEIRVKLLNGNVLVPLHSCSVPQAEWILQAMKQRVAEGKKLAIEGQDEVPRELQNMMEPPDSA